MTPPPGGVVVATDVPWAPVPNQVTAHRATAVPEPWTSALCLVTRPQASVTAAPPVVGERELLLVHVIARGFDAPGGHRDPGESVRDTVVREVAEETGLALGNTPVAVLGYLHLHVSGPAPEGYTYPYPDSYIAVTAAHVTAETEAEGTTMPEEIAGHQWLPLAQAQQVTEQRIWAAFTAYVA